MGVVEAIVGACLEVVAAAIELFELVRNAVSHMPDNSFTQHRDS